MRASRTILTLLLFLAVSFVCPVRESAGDEPQVSLEQIQAMTARWRKSFVNLRVVYELRTLPPLDKPLVDWNPPKDTESAPKFSQSEWIWADHGLDLLDGRYFYWRPGKTTGFRELDVFNGPRGLSFRANYERSPELVEEFTQLEVQPIVGGKSTSYKARAPMAGLYWSAKGEWLPEILAGGECKLEGVETVLGHSCVQVSINSGAETLWLDLQRDGLPRRHRQVAGEVSIHFVVDEFQRLDGGLWFPKRGRIQLLTTGPVQNQLFIVTEAQTNIAIDLTRFVPPKPAVGTVVRDGRSGMSSIHGKSATPQRGSPRQATTPPTDVGAVSPAVTGVVWIIIGLVCASAASLVIGFRLRK